MTSLQFNCFRERIEEIVAKKMRANGGRYLSYSPDKEELMEAWRYAERMQLEADWESFEKQYPEEAKSLRFEKMEG